LAKKSEPGKRVGGFLYVHKDALPLASEEVRQAVARAEELAGGFEWNVAKVSDKRQSLLLYEDFSASAFPALLKAISFDEDGRPTVTDYTGRDNPPILHRKETLIAPDDPRQPAFSAITRRAEELGLFKDSNRIGTRKAWYARLEAAGLKVDGPRLVSGGDAAVEVARERTAISRTALSQPVSLMVRFGMLQGEFELFDYGCGRGDDVAILQANGYAAFGWDPNHRPDGERRPADVVNLGFVINVIEDPHEREETLRAAWSYARRGMAVSVMVPGKYSVDGHVPVSDGFLSRRQTFQKYFSQDELSALVRKVTGERPLPLAPGIVAVFRDKELEQQVSFRRRSRSTIYARLQVPEKERPERPQALTVVQRAREELEAIWQTALQFGRLPREEEIEPEVREALRAKNISLGRALAACAQEIADPGQIRMAAEARREDLLVHFALSLFPGAVRYKTLPASIQRDVRALFGSHSAVIEAATAQLKSIRDREALQAAYAAAAETGYASFEDGTLRFMAENLEQLPVKVRIVAGCAEIVHEGFSSFDFIEVGPDHGVVKGYQCDAPDSALPLIKSTVEVNLGRSISRMRTHSDHVLYLKSRFMPRGHPGYDKQAAADAKLLSLGLVTRLGAGPTAREFSSVISKARVK